MVQNGRSILGYIHTTKPISQTMCNYRDFFHIWACLGKRNLIYWDSVYLFFECLFAAKNLVIWLAESILSYKSRKRIFSDLGFAFDPEVSIWLILSKKYFFKNIKNSCLDIFLVLFPKTGKRRIYPKNLALPFYSH